MRTTDELLDETTAKLATMRVVVDGEDYTITGCDNPERLLLRTALAYRRDSGYYAETPTRNAITSITLRMQDGAARRTRCGWCSVWRTRRSTPTETKSSWTTARTGR